MQKLDRQLVQHLGDPPHDEAFDMLRTTLFETLADVLTKEGVPAVVVNGNVRSIVTTALQRRHRCITLINCLWDGSPSPANPPQTFLHWVEVFGLNASGYHCMNPIPRQTDPSNGDMYVYDAATFESAAAGTVVEISFILPPDIPPVPPGPPRWQSLGGNLTAGLSAIRNQDGRMAVFARGADGALWHIFQVQPNDLLVYSAVVATLGVVALIAAYAPASHAARIDPVVALRQE